MCTLGKPKDAASILGSTVDKGGVPSDGSAARQPQQLIGAAVRANRSEITVGSVARGGKRPVVSPPLLGKVPVIPDVRYRRSRRTLISKVMGKTSFCGLAVKSAMSSHAKALLRYLHPYSRRLRENISTYSI